MTTNVRLIKRCFAVIISIALLVAMLPSSAIAESTEDTSAEMHVEEYIEPDGGNDEFAVEDFANGTDEKASGDSDDDAIGKVDNENASADSGPVSDNSEENEAEDKNVEEATVGADQPLVTQATTIPIMPFSESSREIIYVSADGDDGNDGLTADNAVATLQEAYGLVNDGGTIAVLSDLTLNETVEFNAGKTATIMSYDNDETPSISSGFHAINTVGEFTGNSVMFLVSNGSVVLTNIALDAREFNDEYAAATYIIHVLAGEMIVNAGTTIIGDTIYDSEGSCGRHCIGIRIENDGMFIMNGGTISNNNDGVTVTGTSSFIMNSGTIGDNDRGVWITESGTFTMKSGEISDNNSSGAYVDGNGSFNMDGGSISSNGHSGVNLWGDSSFDISDGTISGNAIGVSVGGNCNATMNNGTISGNHQGVGVSDGNFTITGGSIVNNTSYGVGVSLEGQFTISGGSSVIDITNNGTVSVSNIVLGELDEFGDYKITLGSVLPVEGSQLGVSLHYDTTIPYIFTEGSNATDAWKTFFISDDGYTVSLNGNELQMTSPLHVYVKYDGNDGSGGTNALDAVATLEQAVTYAFEDYRNVDSSVIHADGKIGWSVNSAAIITVDSSNTLTIDGSTTNGAFDIPVNTKLIANGTLTMYNTAVGGEGLIQIPATSGGLTLSGTTTVKKLEVDVANAVVLNNFTTPTGNIIITAPNAEEGAVLFTCTGTTNAAGVMAKIIPPDGFELELDDYKIILKEISPEINEPPTATTVTANSTAAAVVVGTQLTAAYTYNEGTGTGAGADASTYKWYRSDSAAWGSASQINVATSKTYAPTGADIGKYLFFEVTPSNGTLAGTPVQSAAVGQVGIVVSLTTIANGTTGTATINGGAGPVPVTTSPVVVATLGDAVSVAWTTTSGTFTNAAIASPTYAFPTMNESVTEPITITATFTGSSFVSQFNDATNNDVATLGLVGTSVETSNSNVATAEIDSGKIKITSVGVGTATITVKNGSKNATISVTVNSDGDLTIGAIVKYKSNDATLSGLTISAGALTPSFASDTTSYTVNVATDISDIAVMPTVTDTGKATITVNGVAVTSGTACGNIALTAGATTTITIVVTAEDGSTKNYTIAVTRAAAPIPVTGVTLNKSSASIMVGGNETLTATVAPANAANKTVTWSSSTESVATVSNGVVTGVATGTATITVTTADGGFTSTCNVTVTIPVSDITLNKSNASILVGGNETLTATIAPANATNQAVTWSSGNTSVATVSNGTVTGVGAGTAIITATTVDGGFTATCNVTVTVPASGVTLNKSSSSILVGANETLTATVTPANATNKAVTWNSSNASVATVSNGMVAGVGAGTATITVTTADGGFAVTCDISVIADSKVTIEPPVTNAPASLNINTETMETLIAGLPSDVAAAAAGGSNVTIALEVNNISSSIPAGDGTVIGQTITASDTVEIVLNIDLVASAGSASGKITELDSPIQIKIPMPNKDPNRTYKVISVHNGTLIEYADKSPSGSDYILIEVDKFSTFAVVSAPIVSNIVPPPVIRDSSSTGRSYNYTSVSTYWLEASEVSAMIKNAQSNGLDYVRSRSVSIAGIRKNSLRNLAQAGLSYRHDTVLDNAVRIRVYIDEPSKASKDILVSGYVNADAVKTVKEKFEKWYHDKKIAVVSFDQHGDFGMKVQVAAKVNLSGMDVNNLYFYSYDMQANKYINFQPEYRIDTNGFLHFATKLAGYIIISSGPLKGTDSWNPEMGGDDYLDNPGTGGDGSGYFVQDVQMQGQIQITKTLVSPETILNLTDIQQMAQTSSDEPIGQIKLQVPITSVNPVSLLPVVPEAVSQDLNILIALCVSLALAWSIRFSWLLIMGKRK